MFQQLLLFALTLSASAWWVKVDSFSTTTTSRISPRSCRSIIGWQRYWILEASETNGKISTTTFMAGTKKQTSSSVDDMKRKAKKKMSDDDQTQADVEPDLSIGIGAVLESIQGSLTALALTSLRSTLKKAPQQLSPLLVVLDQLSPPLILPPASVVPVKRDFRDELGVVTPIGFFDPIGFTSTIDYARFREFRAAELKHGRVAMVAFLGYLVPEIVRLPDWEGVASFSQAPNGLAAVRSLPTIVWGLLFLVVWWLETVLIEEDGAEPGTFGVGYFGERLEEGSAVKRDKLNKELQNGRLAMLAMMELLTHDAARPAGEGLFVLHHF